MKHMAYRGIGITLFLAAFGLFAGAQNQAPSNSQSTSADSSLGDYARQIRKSPPAATKPKVFDNDNLPKEDKLSIVGAPREASAETSATAEEAATAAPAGGEAKAQTEAKTGETKTAPQEQTASAGAAQTTEEDEAAKQAAWKQWGEKLTAQRDQIDLLTRELDVLKREYQIRAAAMYADVGNRMRNAADWDKQDAQYKQQIADKQKALDDAKQKLDDMQEDARRAGVPASIREP